MISKIRALILGAIIALGGASAAFAADLGGNCCADLEERVAELEATTARKGNRKVSLTVYGQVNAGILHVEAPNISETIVMQGSPETTRFGFRGEGKISNSVAAGYILEVEADGDLTVRHSAVYMRGDIGKLTVGHTSMATDGVAEMTVANTDVAARMLSIAPIANFIGFDLPFDGGRDDVVRGDTASLGGFMASAAWAGNDTWDAALRYAGEFGGFKVAGGIGYRDDVAGIQTVIGSVSAKHVASGVFANAAFGHVDANGLGTLKGYHFQGGIETRASEFGALTIFGEYGWLAIDQMQVDPIWFGAGIVQEIDAAAMSLYASWRRYDVGLGGDDQADVFQAGARIRF